VHRMLSRRTRQSVCLTVACLATSIFHSTAHAQRSRGTDVSSWQGDITQANWNTVRASGIDFAFIRSSRGGTTGTYNQSDPNNTLGGNTLSQSFTDTRFVNNITRARNAGIFAGSYHFSRADIISYVDNGTTVTHTGTDEANKMLSVAGSYMSLGYMRPVYDLEAGANERTTTSLTNFALDFINRIVAVKGYAPIVYINSSYANSQVDSRLNVYDLWMARYIDPAVVNVQTSVDPTPASGLPNVYGVWAPNYPTLPTPRPWDFWQYTSTGTTPGISGNNDLNVANGDIEFVKDFLVPALWQPDADGSWTTDSNWNGSAVQLLPGPNDRVTINKPGVRTITLSSGTQSIRSLNLSETLRVTGGSLASSQDFLITSSGGALRVEAGAVTARTIVAGGRIDLLGGTLATTSTTSAVPFSSTDTVWLQGGTLTIPNGQFKNLTLVGGTLRLTSTSLWSMAESLSLTTNNGTGTSPRSTLDLGRATLVWNYPTTTAGMTAISQLRTGLFDALAPDADPRFTIGYAFAADLVTTLPTTQAGVSIDTSSIFLRRTLKGDANLDGSVNFDDLLKLAASYNAVGTVWTAGDFNYDGLTNFDDLLSLAANYNASVSADWALAIASVPEPAVLTLTLGTAGLALRRRGRR
jgi:GH25 family lysozyme M1 (1,4-beta-N-acetylmuramidase)